jgi:hypothetical protein
MLGITVFSLATLAQAGVGTEHAAKSADNFLRGIDRGDVLPSQLLLSYTEAFGWINARLQIAGKPLLYCVPPKLALRREQAGSILREHVKLHPKEGAYPASMVMLSAMEEAFPCPKENRSGLTTGDRRGTRKVN